MICFKCQPRPNHVDDALSVVFDFLNCTVKETNKVPALFLGVNIKTNKSFQRQKELK